MNDLMAGNLDIVDTLTPERAAGNGRDAEQR